MFLKINIDGVNINYEVMGEGKPILLLHGWGQNKEMMVNLANKLKNKYKCVVLDMPGFGNSRFNEEFDLDAYCETIHDSLSLKLKVAPKYIVGHSFGGKVACHYYLKYNLFLFHNFLFYLILQTFEQSLKFYQLSHHLLQ